MRKITPKQATAIYTGTETPRVLAKRFGIAPVSIYNIREGYSWNSVTGAPRRREA